MEAFTLAARRKRGLRGGEEAAAAMARGVEAAARILPASKIEGTQTSVMDGRKPTAQQRLQRPRVSSRPRKPNSILLGVLQRR